MTGKERGTDAEEDAARLSLSDGSEAHGGDGEGWREAQSHRLSKGTVRENSVGQKKSLTESERHRWAGRG